MLKICINLYFCWQKSALHKSTHSRPKSPRSFCRNLEFRERPFQACSMDADCMKPDGHNSLISFVISKWLLSELSIPPVGQKVDRELWGREWSRRVISFEIQLNSLRRVKMQISYPNTLVAISCELPVTKESKSGESPKNWKFSHANALYVAKQV